MTTKLAITRLTESIECSSCGTPFAMSVDLNNSFLDDHKRSFYCPNGHAQHYIGETEAQRLRISLKIANDERARIAAERDQVAMSLRATRGHVTRYRNRAASGECPFGCGRRFAGLTEHIAKVHPGKHLDGEDG